VHGHDAVLFQFHLTDVDHYLLLDGTQKLNSGSYGGDR
jgi:hypothetical protein